MKPVIIPNPAVDDCEEIAALKKTIEALNKAIKGLEAKKQTRRTKRPAAR